MPASAPAKSKRGKRVQNPWTTAAKGQQLAKQSTITQAGTGNRLYGAVELNQRSRSRWLPVAQDSRHDINCYTRDRLMRFGRLLYTNVGFVEGAVDEVATFAVGQHWQAQSLAEDILWAKQAESLHNESWQRVCNVRGGPYNWQLGFWLAVISAMRDGDVLMVLVRLPSGYPQIQFIPAHRIGSRGEATVKFGPYAGMICFDGIIYNKAGRAVAYQILGDKQEQDLFISARDGYLISAPKWVDQGRCITALASVINDHVDIDDITSYEKFAAKLFAMQTLTEHTEGDPIANDEERYGDETNTDGDEFKVEYFEEGMVRKFRAGSGAKIEAFEQSRPTPNMMAFRRELMRGTYAAIRWPIEFGYDPTSLNGTAARIINGKITRTTKFWQGQIRPAAQKATVWATLCFMDIGLLPWNDQWYRWTFRMPPRLTVDIGREAQQAREDNLKALRTAQDIYDEQALEWREELSQCVIEAKYLKDECEKAGVAVEMVRNLTVQKTQELPKGDPDENS